MGIYTEQERPRRGQGSWRLGEEGEREKGGKGEKGRKGEREKKGKREREKERKREREKETHHIEMNTTQRDIHLRGRERVTGWE